MTNNSKNLKVQQNYYASDLTKLLKHHIDKGSLNTDSSIDDLLPIVKEEFKNKIIKSIESVMEITTALTDDKTELQMDIHINIDNLMYRK